MKRLFLFVMLLNIAFFGWRSVIQDKPEQVKESVYGPPISERIHLLSEDPAVTEQDYAAGVVSNESLEAALNNAITQAASEASEWLCPRIEVERESDKNQIAQVLDDLGWMYQVAETTGKRPKFWLYIPAPETPAIADRIVQDLAAKSIDSFVIKRDEMRNRISLGLYSSMVRAEQAKLRIQKTSGYGIDVYEHMRNVPLQQIDIDQPLDEKDWGQFLSRFDLAEMAIKLEKNPC